MNTVVLFLFFHLFVLHPSNADPDTHIYLHLPPDQEQKKGVFELKFLFTMSFFETGLDYMNKAGTTPNYGGGFRNPGLHLPPDQEKEKGIFGLKLLFTMFFFKTGLDYMDNPLLDYISKKVQEKKVPTTTPTAITSKKVQEQEKGVFGQKFMSFF